MTWVNLTLDRDLTRWLEVDDLVRQLSEAHQRDDQAKLQELRDKAGTRLNQLRSFYVEHKDDERAAGLFEEQMVRLKDALGLFAPEMGSSDMEPGPNSPTPVQIFSDRPPWMDDEDVERPVPVGEEDEEEHGRKELPPQTDGCRPAAKDGASVPGDGAVTAGSRSISKEKKPRPNTLTTIKPLYRWELPPEEREALDASTRVPSITTEYGAFRPGEHPGYYHHHKQSGAETAGGKQQDPPASSSSSSSAASLAKNILDFQVILSESEYRILQARRRALSRHKKPQHQQAGSVLTSTPYVEKWRIQDAMYRPASKEQWIAPNNFSTC